VPTSVTVVQTSPTQLVGDADTVYWPASHRLQLVSVAVLPSRNWPDAQARQATSPVRLHLACTRVPPAQVPHSLHEAAPVSVVNLPPAQSLQPVAADPEYEPTSQLVQLETAAPEYVPAAQFVQEAAPRPEVPPPGLKTMPTAT
jgi:hypothetical protein